MTTIHRLTVTYDLYGRLHEESFKVNSAGAEQKTRRYEYDGLGRITKITHWRVQDHQTTPAPLVTSYAYQFIINAGYALDGGQEIITYPPVPSVGYQTTKLYSDGSVAEVHDQHGLRSKYTYDPNRHWLTNTAQYPDLSGGSATISISYAYDNAGRMIQIIDGKGVSTSYTYDDFDRVVQVTSPDRAPARRGAGF